MPEGELARIAAHDVPGRSEIGEEHHLDDDVVVIVVSEGGNQQQNRECRRADEQIVEISAGLLAAAGPEAASTSLVGFTLLLFPRPLPYRLRLPVSPGPEQSLRPEEQDSDKDNESDKLLLAPRDENRSNRLCQADDETREHRPHVVPHSAQAHHHKRHQDEDVPHVGGDGEVGGDHRSRGARAGRTDCEGDDIDFQTSTPTTCAPTLFWAVARIAFPVSVSLRK